MLLTGLLKISEWAVFGGWLILLGLYVSGMFTSVSLLLELGETFGTLAFALYIATLIPSMVRRLKIRELFPIMSMFLPFRRQFGVLMFITAFIHQSFTTMLPALVLVEFDFAKFPSPLMARQIFGYIAWWLLFPLWLTSNDLAIKKMGKWWKILHKLTYVALFIIMMHVALVGGWNYVFALLVIVIGNVVGLIKSFYGKKS